MEPPDAPTSLRGNQLSFTENLAQSIGNMAPSGGVALTVGLVFALAGNGTWLVFLLVLVAYGLIGLNINEFATRTASPGALYHFSELGFGSRAGLVAGWTYVIALLFCIMSPALTFAQYILVFWKLAGLPGSGAVAAAAFLIAGLVVSVGISIKGVRMSTDLILVMECLSVGLMLVLAAIFLGHSHHPIDPAQLRLSGVSGSGIRAGSVFALFALSGFETVVAFGGESKKALQSIPRALLAAVVPTGLLFAFMGYILVASSRGAPTPLDQDQAPFDHLAAVCGLPFFGHFINAGVTMSFFACTLAGLNAVARVLYAMARRNLVWRRLGIAATHAATPRAALILSGGACLGVPLAMMVAGLTLDQCIDYTTQIGSFGYTLSYLGVCTAAPVYLARRGELKTYHLVLSLVAVAILSLPLVANFYPAPVGAPRYFPYLFLAGVAAATFASAVYSRRRPAVPAVDVRAVEAPPA